MWTRAELKENAKKFFKFNYWKMVLVAFIMSLIGGGGGGSTASSGTWQEISSDSHMSGYMSPGEMAAFFGTFLVIFLVILAVAFATVFFLLNPLQVGAERFFVVSHYQKAELGELGFAFSNSYMNVVKTMFFRDLYTALWSLLFVVPGIIKSYEYRMVPYILAENPGIGSREAFAMSRQMMDGNKWNAFVLDLSFFGWIFLSALTCGILAVFYVNPYMLMTDAELYVALKEITFGGWNQGYQNYQNYQPNQNYQAGQNYRNYQPGQNYQAGQSYQNYQPGQNYQTGQSYRNYQPGQNYQNYQPNQNYQNYQYDQNYQGHQPGQTYQSGQQNQDEQGWQSADWQGGTSDHNR